MRNETRSESFGSRLRGAMRSPEALKPQIELAERQIQVQISKLNSISTKLRDKDAAIFNKVVTLVQKRDLQHANMLANELTEIRKMSKMVTHAKLAFEQIELRLNTIKDIGEIAVVLSPAVGIMKGLAPDLGNVVPDAQNEIGELSGLLSNILVDAGQLSSTSINFETANEEADKILMEASATAEHAMREKFPDIPDSLPVPSRAYEETV
ncbi:MAG: hypothetical protein M1587_03570 [Thaumarchaeota archaeon]|nr:hypothetical protein [Nitrososphaerota archaeon]